MNYTYNINSNKLLKVDDSSNETASFKDVSGNDYTYWADGSLKSDANKGITLIEYNYLKRPKKYTFSNGSTLENQYDANGKKLKSISSDGTVYDFVGNFIYRNNGLYQISHDEGRIINAEYEYEIKDHLGNLRVSFRDSLGVAKITQKQDYDIYGSELQGLSYTKPLWNQDNFKYLGRESIAQTGYIDLLNRQYDRILGRFTSIDPVVEGQEHLSLYQYGWNNPVLRSDPDGNLPIIPILLPFLPEIGAALGVAAEAFATTVIGVGVGKILNDLAQSGAGGTLNHSGMGISPADYNKFFGSQTSTNSTSNSTGNSQSKSSGTSTSSKKPF